MAPRIGNLVYDGKYYADYPIVVITELSFKLMISMSRSIVCASYYEMNSSFKFKLGFTIITVTVFQFYKAFINRFDIIG